MLPPYAEGDTVRLLKTTWTIKRVHGKTRPDPTLVLETKGGAMLTMRASDIAANEEQEADVERLRAEIAAAFGVICIQAHNLSGAADRLERAASSDEEV